MMDPNEPFSWEQRERVLNNARKWAVDHEPTLYPPIFVRVKHSRDIFMHGSVTVAQLREIVKLIEAEMA